MATNPKNPNLDQKGEDLEDDMAADLIFTKRRCCFCIPCFRSDRANSTIGSESAFWKQSWTDEIEGRWWKGWNALKKVKEWSEIVAGPRWKTFIRRFNRKGSRCGKYQYDPLSYALNFDEGHGQNGHLEGEHGYRDFSTRYAAAKSSMDLGKDGPDFATGAGH
ncbi:uncharacterized protein LOC131255494 [Magnolia sinica]|uniref:uncharacterized protein LOC131255494 n=1 Tax=Magnolia sinica TaxID=86752 RepID=UPI00265A15A3|nr:uncharacterized protein LOC131255494 [Magnolia sinica]